MLFSIRKLVYDCKVNEIIFCFQVFHGADNDILWLQRDFHIYVVNLFDTAKVNICFSSLKGKKCYLCTKGEKRETMHFSYGKDWESFFIFKSCACC